MRNTFARLAQAVPDAELSEWLRLHRPAFRTKKLANVTSPKLCDDILQVLERSLPQPHTCDILDLNPGPCLWSRKLHDLLKPRRHVLIEPRNPFFEPFIRPLLSQPDSVYRFAPSLPEALDPNNRLLSEDVYSFRNHVVNNGGSSFALNKNLLITANLTVTRKTVNRFSGSMAKQFFNDYYRSLFVPDDYMHRYGLIRLLAWTGDDVRQTAVPTCVFNRAKQSIQLEATCDVETVAGPSQFAGLNTAQLRWFELDTENQTNVRKRQSQEGIKVPSDRDQPPPVQPLPSLKPRVDEVRKHAGSYPNNRTYIQRLLRLDQVVADDDPEWYARYHVAAEDGFKNLKMRDVKKNHVTPETKLYRIMMSELRARHITFLKTRDFIWETRKLFHRFRDAWREGWFSTGPVPAPEMHAAKATKLAEEDESLKKHLNGIKHDTRAMINKAIDDYRCYDASPKAMAWNRRRYDPLLVQESEFSFNTPLTLFDFTPNPDQLSKLATTEEQICFDYVCTTFMAAPRDSVLKAVKKIVPGGYDEFLKEVPELTNIERGGWPDLNKISVRSLHHDIFIAIARAFCKWPFRPPIERIMAVNRTMFDKGPL